MTAVIVWSKRNVGLRWRAVGPTLLVTMLCCQIAVAQDGISESVEDEDSLVSIQALIDSIEIPQEQIGLIAEIKGKLHDVKSRYKGDARFLALDKRFNEVIRSVIAFLTDVKSITDLDELYNRKSKLEILSPGHPKLKVIDEKIARVDEVRRAKSLDASLEGYEEVSAEELFGQLDTDVLSREDVQETVDTPLRKKKFLQSQEYKDMLAEARASRDAVIGTKGYIQVSADVGEYRLNSHSFVVTFDESENVRGAVDGFLFSTVPFRPTPTEPSGVSGIDEWYAMCTSPSYSFILPVPMSVAEDIENTSVDFYFLFEVGEARVLSYKTRECPDARTPVIMSWSKGVVVANKVTIVVVDSEGEIIFRRKY